MTFQHRLIQLLKEERNKCIKARDKAQSALNQANSSLAEVEKRLKKEYKELPEKGIQIGPSEMVKPEFRGLTQEEIITKVLSDNPSEKFTIPSLAEIIYQCENDDDFLRTKNSIASTLRRGAAKGKWLKTGRGFFQATPTDKID
ncbi:MAG: hypothetical protein ACRC62_26470 [Microcoleus sp.]